MMKSQLASCLRSVVAAMHASAWSRCSAVSLAFATSRSHILADNVQSAIKEALFHVNQRDVVSSFGEDVSDTITHRARAD
jgi:hypothetical protein